MDIKKLNTLRGIGATMATIIPNRISLYATIRNSRVDMGQREPIKTKENYAEGSFTSSQQNTR